MYFHNLNYYKCKIKMGMAGLILIIDGCVAFA